MINEEGRKYLIGSIQLDGIRPSDGFLELAEKEKRGELTEEDICRVFCKKYTVKQSSQLEQ